MRACKKLASNDQDPPKTYMLQYPLPGHLMFGMETRCFNRYEMVNKYEAWMLANEDLKAYTSNKHSLFDVDIIAKIIANQITESSSLDMNLIVKEMVADTFNKYHMYNE